MMIAGEYDFTNWKEKFIKYIESIGNKPSVAKKYARQIEMILEEENITIETLFREIDRWIDEYKTGKYASINKSKHSVPSSALIKFIAFVPTLHKPHTPKSPDMMDVLTGKYSTKIIY